MTDLPLYILLPILFVAAFAQNMAFTAVSRSRNGGDVGYHRKVSYLSNGIWYAIQVLIMSNVWSSLTNGNFVKVAVVGVVYILATSEGSAFMMKRLLKTETGKRRVGAR